MNTIPYHRIVLDAKNQMAPDNELPVSTFISILYYGTSNQTGSGLKVHILT